MSLSPLRREQAEFAKQDAEACERLVNQLLAFHWQVDACGQHGQFELDKSRELARDVIKRLVNYL